MLGDRAFTSQGQVIRDKGVSLLGGREGGREAEGGREGGRGEREGKKRRREGGEGREREREERMSERGKGERNVENGRGGQKNNILSHTKPQIRTITITPNTKRVNTSTDRVNSIVTQYISHIHYTPGQKQDHIKGN